MKALLLVLLCSVLSGCMGFVFESYHVDKVKLRSPIVAREKGYVLGSGNASYDRETIRRYWGSPNQKFSGNSTEIWLYEFSEVDVGFFALLVIIPLPILISDGVGEISFHFQNDILEFVEFRRGYQKGGGCFLAIPMHPLPESGCRKVNTGNLVNGVPSMFYAKTEAI